MAEAKPFTPVKLICGLISGNPSVFAAVQDALSRLFGSIDSESPFFDFSLTDYYEKQMGPGLRRKFMSFERLIPPESLSEIKLRTNALEEEMQSELQEVRRVVNIDPGYLDSASLIMATAKDFAHRVPLRNGIYAHLELLFGKDTVRCLDWTYPDFRSSQYHDWLLSVRRLYLAQIRAWMG
jgi:hypothetical protein